MICSVYHHDFPTDPDALTLVARIDFSGLAGDAAGPLERAWRLTQNVEGSWSRGPTLRGEPNGDYDPRIEVVAPLAVIDGRTYGLRSSMVGDVFEIDGRRFRVASMGFVEIEAVQ